MARRSLSGHSGAVRTDPSGGAEWLLVVFGLFLVAISPFLGRHPELFARKQFPFNFWNDQSIPRRWFVAMAFGASGLAFAVLGVFLLVD